MYVNPLSLGIFIGAVSTILVEVAALIIFAVSGNKGDRK